MTSRFAKTWLLASGLLVLVGTAVDVAAQQTQPTRPVLIQPTAAQQRFRQAVQQSQVRDQIQKAQVEHAIRQQSVELARRPAVMASETAPAAFKPVSDDNDKQTDQAKQSNDQLYQAQQRDRVQRYSDALRAQPVPQPQVVDDHRNNGG